MNLICLDEDENIVDSDCQDQERDDFYDNQTERNPHKGIKPDGRSHGYDHHQHSGETQKDFRVDLSEQRDDVYDYF